MFDKIVALATFTVSTLILYQVMATKEQLLAAFDRIDATTNDIAEDIRQLIAGAGVSQDVVDRAEAIAARLESIAAEHPGEQPPVEDEPVSPDEA